MELHHHQSSLNLSLTQNTTGSYCALPVKDPKQRAFYKKHVASFWTPEEINFSDDIKHLPNLPPDQLHFLSVVLISVSVMPLGSIDAIARSST
jgi:ribonucleotide reductase beta subunit family protein with ferritin-like domain